MRTYLVSGAAGFIGSHLTDFLLAQGNKVIGIDSLDVGRLDNLAVAYKNPNFVFHHEDIFTSNQLTNLLKDVDTVFHLAALADIVPSIEIPQKYFNTNVVGTMKMLEAARDAGSRKFIYAASSSCYGIPESYPTKESANISPMYPYALTKNLGEQLVMHWAQVYGIDALSLRFFNVYGPRARTAGTYGAVFGVFLRQKIAGKPFTVVGDGSQSRDFTYVSDVVSALVCAADSSLKMEILNVGSGNTYTINRLVELLGGPSINIPKRPGEPDITFADITKIKELLGWEPLVTFENGVSSLLLDIDQFSDAPLWTESTIADATAPWFEHLAKST